MTLLENVQNVYNDMSDCMELLEELRSYHENNGELPENAQEVYNKVISDIVGMAKDQRYFGVKIENGCIIPIENPE